MIRTRVVVLAVALTAVVAAAVEATPLTFDQVYYFHDATLLDSSVGANNAIRIQIPSIDEFFGLSVSAFEVTQAQFALEAGAFAGMHCLSYLDDHNCLEYRVTPTGPGLFRPPVLITVAWLLDTNAIAPSPLLIQAEGNDPFSFQLRDQTYFPHSTDGIRFCENDDDHEGCGDDPAESGSTDNFSRIVVAFTPVPEPGTLLLVGSGAVAACWRRWRRRPQGPRA